MREKLREVCGNGIIARVLKMKFMNCFYPKVIRSILKSYLNFCR